MPRLRFHMDPSFCNFFKEALGSIIDAVGGELIPGRYQPQDTLDAVIWEDGIQEYNHDISEALKDFVASKEFGFSEMKLSDEELTLVVQACSYFRLRIRSALLGCFKDEQLEAGSIDLENLSPAVRDAYIVYMGLASIQSEIVDTLL